jgi:hypothetical protein
MRKFTKTILQPPTTGSKGYLMEITIAPELEDRWHQAAYDRAKASFGFSRGQQDLIADAVEDQQASSA